LVVVTALDEEFAVELEGARLADVAA